MDLFKNQTYSKCLAQVVMDAVRTEQPKITISIPPKKPSYSKVQSWVTEGAPDERWPQ